MMLLKGMMLASAGVAAMMAGAAEAQETVPPAAISAGRVAQSDSTSPASAVPEVSQDIIVMASKRAERLQDVASTVNVVQGDVLEKLSIKTFRDIEQLAPGLSLTTTEPGFNAITLRGVGFDPSSGVSPTVDIYFNETPLDSSSAFRGLYDVGQIEVLRGPQGTLRGRTSPSGAITIATRKADLNNIDGYFQQTLTTQDGINSQGAISVPIIPGVLAVRAAGLFDRNVGADGFNIRNGSRDRDRTESGRLSVAFRPTSNLTIDATYQHLSNRTDLQRIMATLPGSVTDPILTPSDRTSLSNGLQYYHYRGDLVTVGAALDLGGATLNYIGGYQNIEQGRTGDLALAGTVPGYQNPQTTISKSRQISQEIRLTSNGKRFWNYLFGAYFDDGKSTSTVSQRQVLPFGFVSGANPPLPISVLDVGVYIPTHVNNYAVFTDHRFEITSRDQIQFGLRYQWQHVRRDFEVSVSGPLLGPVPSVSSGISPDNRDRTTRQLTGGASYRHEFSRDLTAYITYGRSFRPGGLNTTTARLDESLLVTKPETSNNYEIGLKGAALNRKVQFSLALYQQDFKNYLAYTGAYLAVSTTKDGVVDNNAALAFNGDARVRGVEATVTAQLGEQLQIGLSGTYSDAKFKNALAPCNDFNGDGIPDSIGTPRIPVGKNVSQCRLNGQLSAQAPWGLTLNAEYRIPVSGGRELFLRGLANYVPKRTDPFLDVHYDDLLNNSAFFGVRGPNNAYEFSVFAKNLANVSTVTSRNGQQFDYSVFATGYEGVVPVRPREFGLNFQVNF